MLKLPEYKFSCPRYRDFWSGAYADGNYITSKV